MWIPKSDLVELGASEATIYRKDRDKIWESRRATPDGRGQPQKEYLLESLPADLQLKWARLDAKRRVSAVGECSIEGQTSSIASPEDGRLQALQAALARFSPPQYSIEQRQAVEARCLQLARLCDEAIKLIGKLKQTTGISVVSPGASEAGPDRAYHPSLARLAARTASTDPTYIEMYASEAKPISVSTFLRLVKQYQRDGLAVFIRERQTLSPAADKRFIDVPQTAVNWLQSNLKNYVKASVTLYGKKWLEHCQRNNINLPFTDHRPGKQGTCYTWLYRWRQRVPAISMTLATEGEKGIETRYAYVIRDYSELRPRDGFVMDWKTFDVECWVPAQKGKGKPVLTRLVLCTVFDLASRAIFGYRIADRPSARGVTLAYLNAIGKADWKSEPGLEMLCGMQRSREGFKAFVHWDNGKDFRAYAVEGREVIIKAFDLESGLESVLNTYSIGLAKEVGIGVKHAKPFNAKSKIVEPFHRYGVGRWEETMPGYKGNKPGNAPHFYKAARHIHEAFIKGVSPRSEDLRQLPELWRATYEANKKEYGYGTPFLNEAALKAEFARFALEYNRTPHGSLKNDRGELSPIQYLDLNADTPHLMTELTLAALMMEPRLLTVIAGQLKVQWGGEKFIYRETSSELSDGTALYRLPQKTRVEMRFDPNSLGRALVIANGSPLCWVEQPELLGWNATQADFDQANARKKLARTTAREYFNAQSQSTDWRDQASERLPEALPLAVNAGEVFEGREPEQSTPAPVTVLTRFDRKPPDAPVVNSHNSEVSHLRVVQSQHVNDDFDSLKSFASEDDDSSDEIKAGWEN